MRTRLQLKRFTMFGLFLLAFPVLAVAATGPIQSTASGVVQRFQALLLSNMKQSEALGYSGRYQRLFAAVNSSHNLPLIAKISLGRYWRGLSGDQKTLFLNTFRDLGVSTYARRFNHYHGEVFQTLSEKLRADGLIVVRTQLIKAGGGKVHLDYLMRRSDEQWRIVNIIANGVSDLALKRADYTAAMKKNGFKYLISRLKEKIHDNQTYP